MENLRDPGFQITRDEAFAKRLDLWAETFHEKNIKNADAYLTVNETLEEAFGDIQRKFNRIQAKLKYSETFLNFKSLHDDIMDLSIYGILFDMFVEEYEKIGKKQ